MVAQVQKPKIREIKKKIEKIEKILETIETEIDNVRVSDYEELDLLDEVLVETSKLFQSILDVSAKVFNKYWSVKENMVVGVAPTDISEDAENLFVRFFVEFADSLEAYNVEQLYDYIRNHYIEEEGKGE